MKSIGIISKLDKTGGVKLPDALLGLCGVGTGDTLEMLLEGNNVVMKKYPPSCIFCGSGNSLREYMKRSFCSKCAEELKNY